MEQPNLLLFSEGFYYLYIKEKYIHECHYQHNMNVTENTSITQIISDKFKICKVINFISISTKIYFY